MLFLPVHSPAALSWMWESFLGSWFKPEGFCFGWGTYSRQDIINEKNYFFFCIYLGALHD
jgi:hypothetical protein